MGDGGGTGAREVAILGGGCFWCLQPLLEELDGVEAVVAGYAGGTVPNPSYRQVCSGTTGHAEVVEVTFDPAVISFRDVLEVFFTVHDPTTLNRQGADAGTQYRSVVLYRSPEQRETAEAVLREIEARGIWDAPLVTEIAPLEAFFPAEGYHQDYFLQNPDQAYCRVVVAPKVSKFRQQFRSRLKSRRAG